jgi:nicotinate-nucleotide adenylyltransferase
MQKIGLLFGSFNPIHVGHLVLANFAMEYVPFEQIWFVVSPQNPFKDREAMAPARARLEMVAMAIKEEPRFKICDIEFSLPTPSYTINTLQKLKESSPDHQFSMIIGSDNLLHIHRWHDSQRLLKEHPIVVYPRPGFPIEEVDIMQNSTIRILNAPVLEISSTLIRKGISEGKQLRFLVPSGIYDYIRSNRLYSST